ncbi:hypothetical protein [Sphingomonas sp. 2378]|uniref:hypothetical protein n=1 Tax=Sphingomonas sp. 2378 TaxID=1219748 RepID=UPI00311B1504
MLIRLLSIIAALDLCHRKWIFRNQRWIRASEPWAGLVSLIFPLYIVLFLYFVFLLIVIKLGTIKGEGAEAVLFLGIPQISMLMFGVVAIFVLSAMMGGYARTIVERMNQRWSLLAVTAIAGGLFAAANGAYRLIVTEIDVSKGSQVWIVTYMTALLIVFGYICKVPWDRARDIWFQQYKEDWDAADRRRWPIN